MWDRQISLTNRKAEQLFRLQFLSARLQLSDDLSASRIPEAKLPDVWEGAVPITLVSCRDLRCCSKELLGPVAQLGDHSPSGTPDVFSQPLLFLSSLLTLLIPDFFLTLLIFCVGVLSDIMCVHLNSGHGKHS